MLMTVAEMPEFERCRKALGITDAEKIAIINDLATNPQSGFSLGSGIRKWRYAPTGQGKSGGYRIFFFMPARQTNLCF